MTSVHSLGVSGEVRVLLLSRYGRLGASTRLRSLQYIPRLEESGYRVEHTPLLDDAYLQGLYRGRVPHARVALAYIRRVRSVIGAGRFDLLWLEKELLPWIPAAMELRLLRAGTPLVVDYDDATFHRYDDHESPWIRLCLGQKIDAVMRRATVVVAGNEYLAARARTAGCRRVEVVPTVVDLARYPKPVRVPRTQPTVIGWIGSPSTVRFLEPVLPALRRLTSRCDVRCVAIGARPDQVSGTPFEAVPWSEETEVSSLGSLDIGIMPLPDSPWERGKCGYKLVQYMATGLPVVASPVGVNRDIVEDGVNGYLASSMQDWERALRRLIADPGRRIEMGRAGRKRVEQVFSLQAQAPRVLSILRSTLS